MKGNLRFRHLLPIVLLLCVYIPSRAQDSNLTVTEGKTWDYLVNRPLNTSHPGVSIEKGFHFKGTETIEGKEYAVFRDSVGTPIAYMRQDGEKVYVNSRNLTIHNWDQEMDNEEVIDSEYLLYDFSLEVGDRFQTIGFDDGQGIVVEAEVTATYEVENEGRKHRVQEYAVISYGDDDMTLPNVPDAVIVEGIGPGSGYLFRPETVALMSHIPDSIYPLSVMDDNSLPLWVNQNSAVTELLTLGNVLVKPDYTWEYETPWWYGYAVFLMKFDGLYNIDGKYYLNFRTLSHTLYSGDEITEEIYPDAEMFLLREENGKVFMRIWNNYGFFELTETFENSDCLLYDLSMKVGESTECVTTSGITPVTLASMTLPTGQDERKKWNFRIGSCSDLEVLEGIGNISNGTMVTIETEVMSGYPEHPSSGYPTAHYSTYLRRVTDKLGHEIWNRSEGGSVEPIQFSSNTDEAIYDLHGRRVVNPLPGSVYIRDGRKYVAR